MKNSLLLFIIISLFACNKADKKSSENSNKNSLSDTSGVQNSNTNQTAGNLKIAYVLSDTVLIKFTHYQKIKASLTAKGEKIEKEIQSRAQDMQIEYQGYQAKGQNMSPKELQAAEMSLMKKQQDLEAYKNKQASDLMKEEETLNKDLQKKIDTFLESYAAEHGYTFILSKHIGGSVLFGLKELDITKEVIEGLNASVKK